MKKYPKIYPPFKRGSDNRLDHGQYFSPEVELLADKKWSWTEKINGTNVRIHWDGHRPQLGGRTGTAQFEINFFDFLNTSFTEEILEQTFKDVPVTLYGEGIGPGLVKGSGNYSAEYNFVLFDAFIGQWWLRRPSLEDIAAKLSTPIVPYLGEFDLITAIQGVEDGIQSWYGSFVAEGLVGTAPLGLLNRSGERIQVKVKTRDFEWR